MQVALLRKIHFGTVGYQKFLCKALHVWCCRQIFVEFLTCVLINFLDGLYFQRFPRESSATVVHCVNVSLQHAVRAMTDTTYFR